MYHFRRSRLDAEAETREQGRTYEFDPLLVRLARANLGVQRSLVLDQQVCRVR